MDTYGYIYITTNIKNGNRYIGQHKSVDWDEKYIGSGKLLWLAIKKYGKENFTCFPLAWAWSEKELNKLEIYYIAHYKPEYNICSGGCGTRGYIFTDEVKKRISAACKGEKNGMYGKKQSKESIEKNRQSNILYNKTHINKNIGRKHTDEARKNMSKAQKGKKLSEEHKEKLSESHKGIHFSWTEEKKGYKQSEEHKRKRAEGRKLFYRNKRLYFLNKLKYIIKELRIRNRDKTN